MSRRLRKLASLWFGSAPLDRRTYVIAGSALLLLHFSLQAIAIWLVTGRIVGPLVVFSPLLSSRQQVYSFAPAFACSSSSSRTCHWRGRVPR